MLSLISGLLAGLAATLFLRLLNSVTQIRLLNPNIIYGLPIAGFLIGWVYHRFGKTVAAGNNLILDEIHRPRQTLPLRMAPLILLGTLTTHLFGGSAGREGTAVQLGASLSDQLGYFFSLSRRERRLLLVAGASAGFGAAAGAPLAGAIFGMEMIYVGRLRLFAIFECLIASYFGYAVSLILRAPHTDYPKYAIPAFDIKTLFFIICAGAIFGICAKIFCSLTKAFAKLQAILISYPPFQTALAGIILVIFFKLEASSRYSGLGIPVIIESLEGTVSLRDPILKTFFTALTIGSGFKGGEFIPLVFIGSSLGSALSIVFPISAQLLARLGFAAVFAGASNTPIACSLMAIEIFGLPITPYAFTACIASYLCSGHYGIYKSQKNLINKHKKLQHLAAQLPRFSRYLMSLRKKK